MPTSTILLTGFEPFAGDAVNASEQVVLALQGARIGTARVAAAVLPCAFDAASLPALFAALERYQPAQVVCLGQAGSRRELSIERVALNLIDARLPDNAGAQPVDVPVVAGAPLACAANLPSRPSWPACALPASTRRCRTPPAPLSATRSSTG